MRPIPRAAAAALAALMPAVAAGAQPRPPAPAPATLLCLDVTPAFVPADPALGPDGLAARIALARDAGVTPAIRGLASARPTAASARRALGGLRRWRRLADADLAAYARTGDAKALAWREPRRQAPLNAAATGLATSGVACPLALPAGGAPTPAEAVALRMEVALVGRPAARARARAAARRRLGHVPAGARASPRLLLEALDVAADPSAPARERAAARARAAMLREPAMGGALGRRAIVARRGVAPPRGYVAAPDLAGLTIPDAYAALRARGLHLMLPAAPAFGPAGTPTVRRASVEAGIPVRAGATVTVAVRPGLVASPAVSTTQTTVVPDVTNRWVPAALGVLNARALPVTVRPGPLPPTADAATYEDNYAVTRQWPAVGTTVPTGFPVLLRASVPAAPLRPVRLP